MDDTILAADTVDTSETLDDAYGVPMDVVIDEVIAVLQILSLADAVGGYQHIDVFVQRLL